MSDEKIKFLLRVYAGTVLLILAVTCLIIGDTPQSIEYIMLLLAAFLVGGAVFDKKL